MDVNHFVKREMKRKMLNRETLRFKLIPSAFKATKGKNILDSRAFKSDTCISHFIFILCGKNEANMKTTKKKLFSHEIPKKTETKAQGESQEFLCRFLKYKLFQDTSPEDAQRFTNLLNVHS